MKTNKKITNKINDLKNQVDQIINDINNVKHQNNEEIFDIYIPNRKKLEKENSEISKSLNILENDNEKLFSKVSVLKNEVEKAIENFDKESHLLSMFKDFINSQGREDLKSYNFEPSYDSENNDFDLNTKISSRNKDEILTFLKNDNFPVDEIEDEYFEDKFEEKNESKNDKKFLDFFTNVHNIFESEIKKINEISSNKESFLKTFVVIGNIVDPENIKRVSNKLIAYKNEFNQKINSLFEINFTGSSKKENKIVKNSYKNSINDLYDQLESELVNTLNELAAPKTNLNNSILENGINYIDVDNLEELKTSINKVEVEIHSEKIKYNSEPANLESLNDFLFLNKIDSSFIERNISEQYFNISENFIQNTELKKEVLEKLISNLKLFCSDTCNKLILGINENLEKVRFNNNSLTNEVISSNNFFAQKAIELVESIKEKCEEVNEELWNKVSNILSASSFESLKRNKIDFEFLAISIKEMLKEVKSNVNLAINNFSDDLYKLMNLNTLEFDQLKSDLSNQVNEIFNYISKSPIEIEEILKDAYSAQKEFLQFKLLKLEQVLSVIKNFNADVAKNKDFSFAGAGNEYINVRLDKLERQFSKIANMLEPIANKLSDGSVNEENFGQFEGRINKKIDDLISKIASERENYENTYSSVILEVLNANEAHKENVLNLIKTIEEEKMNLISEESKRSAAQNSLKLGELEELIGLQNEEIESLLDEKNQFISDVEQLLIEKREKLNDEKILDIKNSINDVMLNFNEKINDLEYSFDRKLNTINLDSLDLATNENQKELFNKIEETLVNNYQIVKEEVKQDLTQILNNVNELNEAYGSLNQQGWTYDKRFNDIDSQFEQFRYLLKDVTENLINKNTEQYDEMNSIVNNISDNFKDLISGIKEENVKYSEDIAKNVAETNLNLRNKIGEEFGEISEKISNLVADIENKNKVAESNQANTINYILETNLANQKELVGLIKNIESSNDKFLEEVDKRNHRLDNLKLNELDELISLQNSEIQALIEEKNDFIHDLEVFLLEKKNNFNDENINELKQSAQEIIELLNNKIENLEINFENRLREIDIHSFKSELSGNQNDFFRNLEQQLTSNYEIIKNELNNDIVQVINNVNELSSSVSDRIENLSFDKFDSKFDSIDIQFDSFRHLLKDVTENLIDKNSSNYENINNVMNDLNTKFESLITKLRSENNRTVRKLNKEIKKTNWRTNKKIDNSIIEIGDRFANLIDEIKDQNKNFENSQLDVVYSIIEENKSHQREILNYIKNLEENNNEFISQIEAQKFDNENLKLKELEELISLQNEEIESLLYEKNDFINDIQALLLNKKNKLDNENIIRLEDSINNAIGNFNDKISELEQNFNNKLANIDLSSLSEEIDGKQVEFFDSVQNSLSHNYELVKNEFKDSLSSILSNLNDVNYTVENTNSKIGDISSEIRDISLNNQAKFDSIDTQFDSFRHLLKEVTENLIDKNSSNYENINNIMDDINTRFESLITKLRNENNRTVRKLNNEIKKTNLRTNKKLDNTISEIGDKFSDLIQEIKNQNKNFESSQLDVIYSIIEENKSHQREILNYIKNLEDNNNEFINQIEAQKYNNENLKLKELEELISLQNEEIESLLYEKNDFINEVETFLLNKKNKLDNENINRLEDSVNNAIVNFNNKISALEENFNSRLANIDLSSLSEEIDGKQVEFFDSVQSSLSYNYELVKNEFKDSLSNILNNLNEVNTNVENVTNKIADISTEIKDINLNNQSRFDSLDSQFNNFTLLLKEVTEGFINKENSHYDELNNIISNIDESFKGLISSFKDSTNQIGENLVKDIKHSNKHLAIKMDSSIMEMNSKFDRLIEEMKVQTKDIENSNVDTLNMLIESNKNNQEEIFNYVSLLEKSTSSLVNEMQQAQLDKEKIKLKELETLIDLQNSEIESLIDDKNDFIEEIENFLNQKKELFNKENFVKLENSIGNIISAFDKKITDLEFNFDRKLSNLDLSSLKNLFDDKDSTLASVINSVEDNLNSNYEILRNELKLELNKILEDISEANSINEINRNEQFHKLEEVNSQFDQFRDVLKTVTEDIIHKSENNQIVIDDLLEKINDEFRSLIQNLRSENELNSNELMDKFENLNSGLVERFNSNFDNINNKFEDFIAKLDEKTKSFEENRMDLINFVYELNKEYQKNISSYIQKIESSNNEFISDLDARTLTKENDKLKELEYLIDIQNEEIVRLIDENNKYIDEVEYFLTNKKEALDNKKLNDIESSINNISNNFEEKIKKLGENFNEKVDSIELQNLGNNLEESDKKTLDVIRSQLSKNYELLSEEFKNNFASLIKSIENLYSSYGKDSLEQIASELKKFCYEINEGISLGIGSINKNFDFLIKELETKNKILEASQVDAMNLILQSNKINSKEIVSYIENLKGNYANLSQKEKEKQALIFKIFDELNEIINIQNQDIGSLLEERDYIIDEVQKFTNKIEEENSKNLIQSADFKNLKDYLKTSVDNLGNKIEGLKSDLSNKFTEISSQHLIDDNSAGYENILKVEQNLTENYSFLKKDLYSIFENIFNIIDELIKPSDVASFKQKIDDLKEEIDNVNPILASVDKLNKKNQILDEIQAYISGKCEANSNDQNYLKVEESVKNIDNLELKNKISKLDNWYKDLVASVENKNGVISSFVDNKLEEISKLNEVTFAPSFDINAYNLIISKISEISNLLNLSKKNLTGILNTVNARLSESNSDKVLQALKWFNKTILFHNKTIEELNYENNKYLELINANKKNEVALKEASEVNKSLDKILALLKNEFSIFELEQKALISIFKKSLSEDAVIINYLCQVADLSRNNVDLSTRIFINFENKNNIDLIRLHSIQDALKEVSESVNNLDTLEVSKENYIEFNKELDKVKNLLLRSHLDLIALKESQIENSILNTNGDIYSIEYQKITLLEDLVKYTKDYLKNIYSQKVKLVNFLADSSNEDVNCLVEYKASLLCDDLSSQLVNEQLKDLENVIKKIDESYLKELGEDKTDLLSAKNFKNKSVIYSKISLLELEIGKLFEIIDEKKKVIIKLLFNDSSENQDPEIKKILSKFEDSKEIIQNEFNQELQAFKESIFKVREKEINDYRQQVSDIEKEVLKIRNSNSINDENKNKELEAIDNLIEVLNMEISSFEEEKEEQYKDVKEKLAYLNSLSNPSDSEDISNVVNTDKFKVNLNNEVRQYLEETFNSFTQTFNKNLDQLKVALELIKSAYSISEDENDEIDNPSWFKTFDEKLKDIESDLLNSNSDVSKKYVNKNDDSIIELKINSENIKSFIIESESKKKEIEAFYAKVEDLLKLKETK
ncbi:hypothetical protein D8X55_01715 [Malacoplasma penetrans]|uniref:Predicted cytoskeletal protein n=1 Tax=Malacoplasma penetrans (strain HF-2) TaxID=272633 RepID=Q8EWP8_MALP2|nr:hypothetical protein [Malacoplasma penetrans]RXY96991.1 hypothetical protein D8X55_01715 [Malacoplasma penetrans]BAC43946.1 predicted cytoskeletal protein [Malacoplasma penetrans HF-2]